MQAKSVSLDEVMIERASHCAQSPGALIGGKYVVVVNQFTPFAWGSIFNTADFFKLHRDEGGRAFYYQLCAGDPSEPVGVAHFTEVVPGHFRSPRRGTFGGFEFGRDLRLETLEAFFDSVEGDLTARGARKIEIRDSPAIFEPGKSALLANVLHRRGYTPITPDLDYFLLINNEPLWEKLRPSRRQRIYRCRREGVTARALETTTALAHAYEVIVHNRKHRGFPVSMSFESLERMRETFPSRLFAFGAFKEGCMIASSICLEVNSSVFYVFYWGDLPGYEKLSPVTLLAEIIYDFARARGFKLIDFGTATKDGEPIYGLINFKREIGGFPSVKPGYHKLIPTPGPAENVTNTPAPEALIAPAHVLK
jgi:hypothetical protein